MHKVNRRGQSSDLYWHTVLVCPIIETKNYNTPEEQDLCGAIFAYWKTWYTSSTVPPTLAMMCQDLIVGTAKNAAMPLRLGLDSPRFPRIRKDSLDSLRFPTIRSHSLNPFSWAWFRSDSKHSLKILSNEGEARIIAQMRYGIRHKEAARYASKDM